MTPEAGDVWVSKDLKHGIGDGIYAEVERVENGRVWWHESGFAWRSLGGTRDCTIEEFARSFEPQ